MLWNHTLPRDVENRLSAHRRVLDGFQVVARPNHLQRTYHGGLKPSYYIIHVIAIIIIGKRRICSLEISTDASTTRDHFALESIFYFYRHMANFTCYWVDTLHTYDHIARLEVVASLPACNPRQENHDRYRVYHVHRFVNRQF